MKAFKHRRKGNYFFNQRKRGKIFIQGRSGAIDNMCVCKNNGESSLHLLIKYSLSVKHFAKLLMIYQIAF